jgi:hypothetical protein
LRGGSLGGCEALSRGNPLQELRSSLTTPVNTHPMDCRG